MIGKTAERWNSWTVERLRRKTVEGVQDVEGWNRLTGEQLNEETVEMVNGWKGWNCWKVKELTLLNVAIYERLYG